PAARAPGDGPGRRDPHRGGLGILATGPRSTGHAVRSTRRRIRLHGDPRLDLARGHRLGDPPRPRAVRLAGPLARGVRAVHGLLAADAVPLPPRADVVSALLRGRRPARGPALRPLLRR